MALLGVWMFNAVLAPRAAADLAAYVHPTPSAIDFQRALDRDLSDTKAMQAELEARKKALMAEHGVTRDADLPINFSGISLQAGEEHGNEVFDKHFGALYAQFARQGTVHTLAGIFAPLVPVRALSMGLAGTDLDQHRDFVNAAEAYRRGIQKVMNGDIARHQKPGQTYLAGPDLWQKVPPFEYRARSVGTVLAGQGWNLALLAVWCALSIVAASRCAGRVRAV
jgi:ABC-2 type transport system permease protein